MKEIPTIQQVLAKQTKDELWVTAARVGLEPLKKSVKKAVWLDYIAGAMQDYMDGKRPDMGLCMYSLFREEEMAAIHEQCRAGFDVIMDELPPETRFVLDHACFGLEAIGMAWRTVKGWTIREGVPEMLPLDEEIRQVMAVHDVMDDLMMGLLTYTGMLPVEKMQEGVYQLFRQMGAPDEELTDLHSDCMGVFAARYAPDSFWVAPDKEVWMLHPDLDDPEALWHRLQEPFIRKMAYPTLDAKEVVYAMRDMGLPGEMTRYDPLLQWMEAHCKQEEIPDLIYDIIMAVENERGNAAFGLLMQQSDFESIGQFDEGMNLLQHVMNDIPRWWNKGWSPTMMMAKKDQPRNVQMWSKKSLLGDGVMQHPQGRQAQAVPMPGRNDPCPCGSGKKYKHCCGKRLQ